jgi:hypothetical protein
MNCRISIALLLLAAAGPALAHGELPTITACSGHKPTYLGTFGYLEKGLREYKICLTREAGNPWLRNGGGGGSGSGSGQPPVCRVDSIPITMVACPAQTCGEFDDDYRTARALALAACSAYVGAGTDYPDGGLVVPMFNGPETFLDDDHHQVYELSDGISGICGLCPE